MVAGKNSVINLSTEVIFTREGVNIFRNSGRNLKRISMIDGVERYGLRIARVSAPTFQSMVRVDCISQIQVTRPEFISVRSDLMDFSKLIFFGVLYRNFDTELFDLLISSPKITDWNRHNPGNVIDKNTRIQDSFIEKFLADNKSQTQQVRKEIIEPVIEWIERHDSWQPEEKVNAQLLLNRYLDYCRPFIWFVLCRFIGNAERVSLVRKITSYLEHYLQKAQIADYLTLLLMEITVSAEDLAILSDYKPGKLDIASISEIQRAEMLNSLEKQGRNITVYWRLNNPSELSIGRQKKMELVVYNNELGLQEARDLVSGSGQIGNLVSLSDFYEESSGENARMGLTYMGHLEEECRKAGMHIKSSVGKVSERNTTAISLAIRL